MGVTGIMFLGCPSFHPSSFHSCNNLKNVQRVHFVYAYADTMTCLDFGVMRLKVKLTVFNKIKNSYECIVLKITLEPRDWSTSTLAHVCTISEEGVSPSLILLSVNKSIGGGVGWWNFHISLYNFNLTFIRVLHYQCHNYKVHVPISGTFMNSSFVQKSTCSQRLFFFHTYCVFGVTWTCWIIGITGYQVSKSMKRELSKNVRAGGHASCLLIPTLYDAYADVMFTMPEHCRSWCTCAEWNCAEDIWISHWPREVEVSRPPPWLDKTHGIQIEATARY